MSDDAFVYLLACGDRSLYCGWTFDLERRLAADYESLLRDEVLPRLVADNHALAQQIARVPERIRGYGHVKLGNLATGRAQWRVLLDKWHGRGGDAATMPGANERGRVIPISVA